MFSQSYSKRRLTGAEKVENDLHECVFELGTGDAYGDAADFLTVLVFNLSIQELNTETIKTLEREIPVYDWAAEFCLVTEIAQARYVAKDALMRYVQKKSSALMPAYERLDIEV